MPDAASALLGARILNHYAGTSYTLEEVAQMDPLIWDIIAALQRGLEPPKRR